jgi:hypothetical protein
MLGCWFRKKRSVEKVTCTQGFSKPASGTKGPVDLFKRFQQGTREPFRLVEVERSSDWEVMDPTEVGGLHPPYSLYVR